MIKKRQRSLETLIGGDSVIKGEVISKGVIRIDGSVEGAVRAHRLFVGKSGLVHGDISVKTVEIDGKVEGNIVAEDTIEIRSEGILEGDVRTAKLVITEGALFYGTSYMERPGMVVEESGPEETKKVERIRG